MSQTHPSHRRHEFAPGGKTFRTSYERGVVCLERRDFAGAVERFREALNSSPNDASASANLGLALGSLGCLDEALSAFDAAVAAKSDNAEIHYNRANVLKAMARYAEALAAYDAALQLRPNFAEALSNRGNVLKELGRVADALASFELALTIRPRLIEALCNKAILLDEAGSSTDALAAYDRALSVATLWTDGYSRRGQILAISGRAAEALADLAKAARLDPKNAKALALLGDELAKLGKAEEAANAFREAIKADPDFAEAYDHLGLALTDMGRIEEARRAHEQAVALCPEKPGFYYNLTTVAELGAADVNFRALTRLAGNIASLKAEEQIPLHFALAKAHADQGEPRSAFRRLRQGNALKRRQIAYNEPAALADMENVRFLFTERLLTAHRGLGNPSAKPIFVVGMPRSGSTLIEQILASCPGVFGAGETTDFVDAAVDIFGENLRNFVAAQDDAAVFHEHLRGVGDAYLNRLARFGPAERVVNKMLDNFRLAGLIHLALPNARIIHARRNPVDTCLSCYSKLFSADIPYAYDLAELGRYYQRYDALMEHWRSLLRPEILLEVNYEDLVIDPETQARRIVDHCGLDWDRRCLDFHTNPRIVRTASAVQVRRPIYSDAVGKWTQFGADLDPLISALGACAPNSAAGAQAHGAVVDRLRGIGERLRRLFGRRQPPSDASP